IRMPFISGIELARQIQELYPMTSIVFLSGFDDFTYAQKAIRYNVVEYLLKPISMAELTAELVRVREKIEQRYANLFHPRQSGEDNSQELLSLLLNASADEGWLERFDMYKIFPQLTGCECMEFMVFVTQLRQVDGPDTLSSVQALADNVVNQFYPAKSIPSGGRIVTLAASKNGFDNINTALDELYQAIRRVVDVECVIGVSRVFATHKLCHTAFTEAVDALRFNEENGIHHVAEISKFLEGDSVELWAMDADLEGLIRNGSRAELERYLHSQFSAAQSIGGITKEITPMIVMVTVYRVLQKSIPNSTIGIIFRRCKIPANSSLTLSNELNGRLVELCLAAQNLLKEQNKDGISLLCRQAMDQIERNYMEDNLSLASVSKLLHVSPNYLSTNMKKYVGDTFINLLIKKRMTVAAELLCTTKLKVLEVSRRCGYTDQHYFSYCFKKYYGISPAQMRQQAGQKRTEG
ncbi:MAG: AraC family transcriptional regulator, partial [Oscillospiraceae bacterium]|nr:AraC family transcriptional regulator [Oscillospiraceae bacterium]